MPSTQTMPPTLDSVVRRIHDISTLPHVALRVMEVANNPSSGAQEMKEAMESDAALSARVLRCVNSSAYAVRDKITNLLHAIAYLGVKQIRNLAMTAAVSELFQKDEAIGRYTREGLWRHLVSVGLGARLIALRLSFANFEDIFLAGLLHDIGIILEDQYVHGPFCDVIESLQEGTPLCHTEFNRLGWNHTQLGEKVAESWRFPDPVKDAIRHHHGPASYSGDHLDVVRCVEIANLICTLKGISAVGEKLVGFSREAFDGLSLHREDIQVLAESFDEEFSTNAVLFDI